MTDATKAIRHILTHYGPMPKGYIIMEINKWYYGLKGSQVFSDALADGTIVKTGKQEYRQDLYGLKA